MPLIGVTVTDLSPSLAIAGATTSPAVSQAMLPKANAFSASLAAYNNAQVRSQPSLHNGLANTAPRITHNAGRGLLFSIAALCFIFTAHPASAAWETPGTPTNAILENAAIPAPGVTTTISNAYFKITQDDVAKAVAEQLQLQAVVPKADVTMNAGTPGIIYAADHPLKVSIHSLQIDAGAKRWQAQAYVVANGQTEIVKPVAGTYAGLVDVPVLTRQLGRTDVIEAKDLTTKSFPERLLRKDTVTDASQLIGQSPRATISTDRPIRQTEVSSPILIKKNQAVQMTYTNPYMSLKVTGVALQDGARGDMVRIKNDKSEKAVSGRVTGPGMVEVNTQEATITPTATPAPAPIAPPAHPPVPQPAPEAAPQVIPVTPTVPPTTTPFPPAQH